MDNDNDDMKPDKVADAARQMIEWPPSFAKGAAIGARLRQGRRTPVDQGSDVSRGAALHQQD